MESGAVSSSRPATARFVTHDGMLSVRIIVIWFNKLWGIGRVVQHTNRFFGGDRNGIWKRVRGVPGYFGGWGLSSMGMVGRFKSRMPQ